MSILYWITVLGNLYAVSLCILIVLILIIIFLSLYAFITREGEYVDEEDIETADKYFKIVKKLVFCSIIPLLILIFVPSTEKLYAIYGVGTVIDYAKESKEAQKLPDNAVKALNTWFENVNKDNKNSTNSD